MSTPEIHPTRLAFLPRSRADRSFAVALCALLAALGVYFARELDGGNRSDHGTSASFGGSRKLHNSPIIDRGGKRLLWAHGDPASADADWFDVTDSAIDPEQFRHGLGRDTIQSIDDPVFVDANDPRVREQYLEERTYVIGYAHNGEAKAYPLDILNRHELVNDHIGGKPVTVGW